MPALVNDNYTFPLTTTILPYSVCLLPPPIYGAYCSVTGSEASGGGPAEAVGFAWCGQAVATAWRSSFPFLDTLDSSKDMRLDCVIGILCVVTTQLGDG